MGLVFGIAVQRICILLHFEFTGNLHQDLV